MFSHLQINRPVERWLVGAADAALSALTLPGRLGRRPAAGPVGRVLLLRCERVGDLVMTLSAIGAVRRGLPHAHIDLVVGSWNRPLADLLSAVDDVQTLDLPWLSRGGAGAGATGLRSAIGRWRARRYDLAINFEGDIRSHGLMWASGARRRVGFDMAGGGPLLTDRVPFDPAEHVSANCSRLVERACGSVDALFSAPAALQIPPAMKADADARLQAVALGPPGCRRVLIGVHASAGRLVKQWPAAAFAEAATALARRHDAVIVLTGGDADRPVVSDIAAGLAPDVARLDLAGQLDLVQLAALIERLDLVVSVDTGPMHLAAAVGTPVVGIFGPSDPRRWGPSGRWSVAVRADLPCSPCNRIRTPPARCMGHIPDCMAAVMPAHVVDAANALLARRRSGGASDGQR